MKTAWIGLILVSLGIDASVAQQAATGSQSVLATSTIEI